MLTIRLSRVGKRNAAVFHVVLTEKSSPVKGKFVELLGFYNPRTKEKNFKADRIQYWKSQGVQFSPTVFNLLIDAKIIEGEKVKAWKPKKKEKPTETAPAEAPKQEAAVEKPVAEAPVAAAPAEEAKEAPQAEKPAEVQEEPKETAKEQEPEAPQE